MLTVNTHNPLMSSVPPCARSSLCFMSHCPAPDVTWGAMTTAAPIAATHRPAAWKKKRISVAVRELRCGLVSLFSAGRACGLCVEDAAVAGEGEAAAGEGAAAVDEDAACPSFTAGAGALPSVASGPPPATAPLSVVATD